MAKKKKATAPPTGMTVVREGTTLTCSWLQGASNYNDGQQFQTRLSSEVNYTPDSCNIGTTTTSKTYTLPLTYFYPYTNDILWYFLYRVRGNKANTSKTNYTVSAWAECAYYFGLPRVPTVSIALKGGTSNTSTVTWSEEKYDNDAYITTHLEYETMLIKDCPTLNGAEAFTLTPVTNTYATGLTTTFSGSSDITENSTTLASGSCTRWYRIRGLGPRGWSDWSYAYYTYAQPNQANIRNTNAEVRGSGLDVVTQFDTTSTNTAPIDIITPQYIITTPAAGLTIPAGATGWTDAPNLNYTTGNETSRYTISGTIPNDQCLFTRTNTTHGTNTTYGEAQLAGCGALDTPTLTSVSTSSGYQATITATNNSDVPDSFLLVGYSEQSSNNSPVKEYVLGVIPHNQTSTTIQCPNWTDKTVCFYVQAAVGTTTTSTAGSLTLYNYKPFSGKKEMLSPKVYRNGDMPIAPTGVTVTNTNTLGTINVKWNWNWSMATGAQISWATSKEAWQSTEEPSTYEMNDPSISSWYISGLDANDIWYVRVRFKRETSDATIYGPWSDLSSSTQISLAEAPARPSLIVSDKVIAEDGQTTLAWAYVTNDGTPQNYAEVCKATVAGSGITYGNPFDHTITAQHITLNAKQIGTIGNTYYLCVRVRSASGLTSAWSSPVAVSIATPLTAAISSTSLTNVTVPADDDNSTTRTVLSLTDLPLTVTVTGAGSTGTTRVVLERTETYTLDRPNGIDYVGYKGETVAVKEQLGSGQMSIGINDLVGSLDDGALYTLVATVKDGLGQSDTAKLNFEVHWSHQAIVPAGSVVIDASKYIAKITPTAPTGAIASDKCDIYRLSTDRPELIYADASFGTTYVDPYPALGEYGGHRIVFKTKNGDYITQENRIALLDFGDEEGDRLDTMYNLIDFNGERIELIYDINLSNSWEKDFQETKYLGGSVQGDWNPSISRTGNVSSNTVTIEDQDTIMALRRLADWPGICHVRTRDGSSYAANIDVSESRDMGQNVLAASFTLDITRVDPEGFEGMTEAEWNDGE